jgi:hypothetical protein
MAQPRTKRKRKPPRSAAGAAATRTSGSSATVIDLAAHPRFLATTERQRADLDVEQRWGRVAAVAAAAVIVLTLGAVPVAASGPRITAPAGGAKSLLLGVSRAGAGQLLAMGMRVASVLLVAVIVVYLYRATSARAPTHRHAIPILGLCAVTLVAASTAVGFFEVRHVAYEFVAAGPRTAARAHQLLAAQRHRPSLLAADIGHWAGAVAFGIWISLASHEATSVGLLTRFLGIFGIAAGLTTVLGIPVAPALFAGWLASVGALAAGYWPGGRPPAWDPGRAISWDTTHELEV